ncbi:MAG: 1-(5-phosphoribosyl)-5-[(5-phosphoribosylamino)methylideneamino]imidazole-4-carboxamide isomerase [Lysobacterales bacterium]
MIVIPAIDLREGRVVRLRQGDYAAETRYPDAPEALARAYAEAGARELHLVDLDAARNGHATQSELIAAIAAIPSLAVQAGGGVRRSEDVEARLAAGLARVVIGSVAVRDPAQVIDWSRRFGAERIVLALDTRRGPDGRYRLPVAGWTETSEVDLFAAMARFCDAGLKHFLVTDIKVDGMLCGPNLPLYAEIRQRLPDARVQASGGIAGLADLRALAALGLHAAIVGRALLEGRFTLAEALAC